MADSQQFINGAVGWAMWAQSAVNGLVGDRLHGEQNPLAISMALYAHGRSVETTRAALAGLQPLPTGRIALLVHGLGCSESMWNWQEADGARTSYGHLLQTDFGYTPFSLRYNTGLPIAANGRRLNALLEDFAQAYPLPIEEILLVGHSMGGLVIRHACYEASANLRPWVDRVQRIIYLGLPHNGADLERFAHIASSTLRAVPNPITHVIGRVLDLRSQGVQDLRHGAQHAADAEAAPGEPLPWLRSAQHYLIAGTLGSTEGNAASLLFGDGLVRPQRALQPMGAQGETPPATHIKVFPGIHHMGLARSHAVYAQMRVWCAADGGEEG